MIKEVELAPLLFFCLAHHFPPITLAESRCHSVVIGRHFKNPVVIPLSSVATSKIPLSFRCHQSPLQKSRCHSVVIDRHLKKFVEITLFLPNKKRQWRRKHHFSEHSC
ncbi:hypothetical protein BDB00DRAFT_793824 [Zychaea mexicana]|uniref:uncharacterized protein n=1 Tax=Zychaea mexicana TaxID=64656 RepID=UPI0022FDF107|nr:uncharacterized protein BDB00DRAFT_793824 [Zychaea mexicana]KAI9467576.1 hypothetical protein BDB00DRAFT_793824 [Zychaea mexicana]